MLREPYARRVSSDTSADRRGQAAEWLVWTRLTLSSQLHVFLPLRDMGIDAIVRLPGTDIASALQVKSRSILRDGKLHLLVRDSELTDPHALIIAVVLDAPSQTLHDTALCIDVLSFRRLAFARGGSDHGSQASIPFPPTPASRWYPYAVPLAQLAERICPESLAAPAVPAVPPEQITAPGAEVGYRAEARLVALLADDPRLNTFKAFPDLEMVEYCVRHVGTAGIAGIQVKAISVDAAHPRGSINVPPHTFVATPASYFLVLAERRADQGLHPHCLLIPSLDMGDLLIEHAGQQSFTWDPDSPRHDAGVAAYRCPTAQLAAGIAALLE
ncbi:MAG: hypothetical protein NVSMB29_16470 [Candidatus Dormibacteria bacterium]